MKKVNNKRIPFYTPSDEDWAEASKIILADYEKFYSTRPSKDISTEENEETEPWNKIVCDNLRGSAYLKVWNNLPYAIRQSICESFNEYFNKT